jgi:hypothetical protein
MANDFNLQKFLIENKMTRNSRLLSENINDLFNQWKQSHADADWNIDANSPEELRLGTEEAFNWQEFLRLKNENPNLNMDQILNYIATLGIGDSVEDLGYQVQDSQN